MLAPPAGDSVAISEITDAFVKTNRSERTVPMPGLLHGIGSSKRRRTIWGNPCGAPSRATENTFPGMVAPGSN